MLLGGGWAVGPAAAQEPADTVPPTSTLPPLDPGPTLPGQSQLEAQDTSCPALPSEIDRFVLTGTVQSIDEIEDIILFSTETSTGVAVTPGDLVSIKVERRTDLLVLGESYVVPVWRRTFDTGSQYEAFLGGDDECAVPDPITPADGSEINTTILGGIGIGRGPVFWMGIALAALVPGTAIFTIWSRIREHRDWVREESQYR